MEKKMRLSELLLAFRRTFYSCYLQILQKLSSWSWRNAKISNNLLWIWAIGLIESLRLFWNLAYTFALDDRWWPWPEFEFLCPKCFLCQKYTLWKFALDDLWWSWPPMMPKMLFLYIGTQKFAFDNLWWPWPDFDLPWCQKCFFYA